jgi:hypothetical protein
MRFEVRRSRIYALGHILFSTAMLALAVATLAHAYSIGTLHSGAQFATAGFFAFLMAAYVWQGIAQFLDRSPTIVMDPEGLFLPAAGAQTIPWGQIERADCYPSLLHKGRLEIQVDPHIYAKMRFGRRIFGDNIVSRAAIRSSFAIYAQGYDHKALEIFTALRKFWPPDSGAAEP